MECGDEGYNSILSPLLVIGERINNNQGSVRGFACLDKQMTSVEAIISKITKSCDKSQHSKLYAVSGRSFFRLSPTFNYTLCPDSKGSILEMPLGAVLLFML